MISRVMSVTPFISLLLLSASSAALLAGPGASNPFGGRRVIVIGIDGCRSDALKQQVEGGNAPNIAGLISNGTVTWNAYSGGDLGTPTQQVTSSGPNWTSILTGTWIDRHNVNGNSTPAYDQPAVAGSYLVGQAPHFARRIKESAPSAYIASIVNWDWLENYLVAAQPSYFDYHATSALSYDFRDGDVAAKAANVLSTADPDVIFLQFDQADHAGHAGGFSPANPVYLTAISNVDTCIGTVLSAINARPQAASEQWLKIIITDHGGTSGGSHGGQSIEERTIPFVVSGAGVPAGIVSTASPGDVAVAPTVMRHLGISIPSSWQFAQNAFATGPSFRATGVAGAVQLSWELPSAGIPGATGFEVFRNGTSLGTFPLAQTSLTDSYAVTGTVTYQLAFTGTAEAPLAATLYIAGTGQLVWDDANPNNNWNTTDANWSGGTVFTTGKQALFTSATGESVIVGAAGVSPSDTSIIGNGSYTFSGGPVSGTLTKGGTGTLALNSPNNFSAVTINAGNILLGNTSALGGATVTAGTGASTDTTGGAMISTTSITTNAVVPNAITLPADTASSNRALYMYGTGNGTNTLELSGKISGGSSFTTLYLNNNQGGAYNPQFILSNSTNDFRANLMINRGGLQIASDAALGNAANTVTFNSNAGADLTFNGAMTYTRATTLSTATDFDTKSNNVTASGVIGGGSALTKLGAGGLTLAAANTYSGSTTISGGSITLSGSGSLGGGSYAGAVSLAAGTSLIHASSTAQTFSGVVSGAGSLSQTSGTALTLSGANSFSGGTTITNGPNSQTSGAVVIGNNTSLGTGAVTLGNTAQITGLFNGSASRTISNNIALSSSNVTTRFLAGNATTFQLDGVVSGGTATSTLLIDTNTGNGSTGLVKLTNPSNTFSGKIQINRGGLAITSDGALGNAANTIFFDIGTTTQTGLRFDAAMTCSRAIQTGGGKQVFDTNGNNVVLTGVVSGTGQLFKTGAGSLALTNSQTYSGITTVDNGSLLVNGALGTSASAVTVSASASLGGGGIINRPVTVAGNLSPGNNSAGSLVIGSPLAFSAGSSMSVQVADWTGAAGTGYDTVSATAIAINATAASKLSIRLDFTGVANFTDTNKVFTIASAAAPPTGLAADNWTVDPGNFPGSGTWSLQTNGNNVQLVYTNGFTSWIQSKGLSGAAAAFAADPDEDGLANGIEFVLGTEPNPANPAAGSGFRLPTVTVENNSLVFTYQRVGAAATYQIVVDFSPSPAGPWTTAVDPGNATISTLEGSPDDTVTVSIPRGTSPKLFARLRVTHPD